MAWEKGKYYTRTRWVNGKRVQEYVGGGMAGERAAAADCRRREEAALRRKVAEERRARMAELEAMVIDLEADITDIVRAAAVLGGCYIHRGELRRRGR